MLKLRKRVLSGLWKWGKTRQKEVISVVKKGLFQGPTASTNYPVACPHAKTSTTPNLNLDPYSVCGDWLGWIMFRCISPVHKSIRGNPFLPIVSLFPLSQNIITSVWYHQYPYERKPESQSQPCRSTCFHAPNITKYPKESLFKIPKTIWIPLPQRWGRSLPSMLTTFQGILHLFGDCMDTGSDDCSL